MIPVVRNIDNNQLYLYLGNDNFQNIITGKTGVVGEEKANRVFKFSIEATEIINEYPAVKDLIKTFNLRVDK